MTGNTSDSRHGDYDRKRQRSVIQSGQELSELVGA